LVRNCSIEIKTHFVLQTSCEEGDSTSDLDKIEKFFKERREYIEILEKRVSVSHCSALTKVARYYLFKVFDGSQTKMRHTLIWVLISTKKYFVGTCPTKILQKLHHVSNDMD
jgi:hypothetical protein